MSFKFGQQVSGNAPSPQSLMNLAEIMAYSTPGLTVAGAMSKLMNKFAGSSVLDVSYIKGPQPSMPGLVFGRSAVGHHPVCPWKQRFQ